MMWFFVNIQIGILHPHTNKDTEHTQGPRDTSHKYILIPSIIYSQQLSVLH